GYVASINRPGGNVTGVSWFGTMIVSKGLSLLLELVPSAALIAVLANPKTLEGARIPTDAQEAAHILGGSCWFSMPARRARSTPRSRPCDKGAPTRFLSEAIHSFPAGGSKLLP